MKEWRLTYESVLTFSSPVSKDCYSLRCIPCSHDNQKLLSCRVEILPENAVTYGRDSFGNLLFTGTVRKPHTRFAVKMDARVSTKAGIRREEKPYHQLGMYRYESEMTRMGQGLKGFMETLPSGENETPWERTGKLMYLLWDSSRYLRGSTGVDTTAEQAFVQGCGVCQDYAHILLALCRREGMTARYVAGTIPGEGQTHAWIEVWQDGGWKGFDPTNRKETDEDYICFAVGRDARDCTLNRGIFLGNAVQTQDVYVRMEEMRGINSDQKSSIDFSSGSGEAGNIKEPDRIGQ